MSTAEQSQRWRDVHPGAQYRANKSWRHRNPETRHEGKKRNYAQSQGAANSGRRWSRQEDTELREWHGTDRELSAAIGRSVQAIQQRRSRLGRES